MIADRQDQQSPKTEQPEHARFGDFAPSAAYLHQLNAHLRQYASLEIDRLKLKVRKAVVLAVLGLVVAMVGTAVLIAAVVLVLQGLAQAIAAALGDTMWAGNLIVGVGVFAILALGVGAAGYFGKKSSFARTKAKHEHWQQRNRSS
jgi:hypothetical protein